MPNLILHLIREPLRARETLILENVAMRNQLQVLSRGQKCPALKNQVRDGLKHPGRMAARKP